MDESQRHVLQVLIRARDLEALRPLLLEGFDFGCRLHPEQAADGSVTAQAYVEERELEPLRRRGYEVRVIADATAAGRERQAEVGRDDRFEGGRIAPRGLGRKTGKRSRRQ